MATRRKRTRAPNQAGSTYREKKTGRWVAAVTIGQDDQNRPIRRKAYAATEADARVELIRLQGLHQKGALAPQQGRTPTLAAFIEDWLDSRDGQISERTLRRYKSLLVMHVVPTLGRTIITKLTDVDVTKLLAAKVKAGMSPKTAFHVRAALRTCMGVAVKRSIIIRNPAADAVLPKQKQVEMKTLTAAEVRHLIECSEKTRDGYLHAFLVSSGVRLGEALGARWDDYEAKDGILSLSRQLQRRADGTLHLDDLKTAGSVRTLHLSGTAREALESQRRRQHKERLMAGPKWKGDQWNLMFMTADGQPMDGPAITKRFHVFMAEIGLPTDLRVHDLRHTYATLALANGAPVLEVSKALGHSKPVVTLNTYGHSSAEGQKALASRMDGIFGR